MDWTERPQVAHAVWRKRVLSFSTITKSEAPSVYSSYDSNRRKESIFLFWFNRLFRLFVFTAVFILIISQLSVQEAPTVTLMNWKLHQNISGKLTCLLKPAVLIASRFKPSALACSDLLALFPGGSHSSANLLIYKSWARRGPAPGG